MDKDDLRREVLKMIRVENCGMHLTDDNIVEMAAQASFVGKAGISGTIKNKFGYFSTPSPYFIHWQKKLDGTTPTKEEAEALGLMDIIKEV